MDWKWAREIGNGVWRTELVHCTEYHLPYWPNNCSQTVCPSWANGGAVARPEWVEGDINHINCGQELSFRGHYGSRAVRRSEAGLKRPRNCPRLPWTSSHVTGACSNKFWLVAGLSTRFPCWNLPPNVVLVPSPPPPPPPPLLDFRWCGWTI